MVYKQEDVFKISSECMFCKNGKFNEAKECVCNRGYILEGAECKEKDCPEGMEYSPRAGKCKCPIHMVEKGEKCFTRFELCLPG